MTENHPAGWVSPSQHEAQQRALLREVILREREAAFMADLEAEVDRRIEAATGPQDKPADPAVPVRVLAVRYDGEHDPVSD